MAVELAREGAKSSLGSNELSLEPCSSYETLLADLVDASSLSHDLLDQVLTQLNTIFYSSGPSNPALSMHGPRLIRERNTCPQRVPPGVMGLLNVGLIQHNQNQIDRAVSTYLQALSSWMQHLPESHPAEGVLMVICSAVGAALESASRDEAALAVYTLGVVAGTQEPEPTPELGYCNGCMGSVLFHMGLFESARAYFRTSLDIRTKLRDSNRVRVSDEEVAVVQNNLGACSVALTDNVHGMEMYKLAYAVLREKHAPNHAYVCAVNQNMQRAKLNIGNHEVNMSLVPRPIFRPKKPKKEKSGKKKKKKK
eukprot:TRINITY_DN3790_c0_g1_i1.p1 TRINITY_DN3790_c0_g1~~TRINITY_DN3790_c0_g1_i1.p1  ORF type:complete len:310 (-),score=47.80 TRINITY_DN3790_c0_g1_i1:24-953(-)